MDWIIEISKTEKAHIASLRPPIKDGSELPGEKNIWGQWQVGGQCRERYKDGLMFCWSCPNGLN